MDPSLEYINNRLSLRKPQTESLITLNNVIDYMLTNDSVEEKLRKTKIKYSHVTSFDRDFPSLCFALATGVGKTRLMGAFIAYLYIVKGIKNFMIVAPNITIYNKLCSDFSDEGSDKYVFKGLKEFVQSVPKIVTGENYKEQGRNELWKSDITINIFNIDKINKYEQSIKSLSEYLGKSYYDCLIAQKNLVVLMDESHHYRADRGMAVLNELNPVLGLELTATPQIEKNNKTVKFNNIIYDYPLYKAMVDGYVKEPSVATKKNFNVKNFNEEQLDQLKLKDGLAIHENTKIELEDYSKTYDKKLIKPFTMVICKNIDHAKSIIDFIKSDVFYNGRYKEKVMMITSKDGSTEKDENVRKLLFLEHPLNKIEIVVHVNMLKEGWDVNNLYTIIPLRRSASQTLTEQTMGRGLRLPYGNRTGNEAVDRLTIVSHDKYQEIIEEANKETSILKASNIIDIDDYDLKEKETIVAPQLWELEFDNLIEIAKNSDEILELEITKEMKKMASGINGSNINFKSEEVKNNIINNIKETVEEIKEIPNDLYNNIVEKKYEEVIAAEKKFRINIPYISPNVSTKIEQIYADFKLDYVNLEKYKPLDNDIIIQHLGDGDNFEIKVKGDYYNFSNPKELLFEQIFKISNVEYEKCSDILNNKITEYINFLEKKYSREDIINILYNYSSYISKEICNQLISNMKMDTNLSNEIIIEEYSKIVNPVYKKIIGKEILDYKVTIDKSLIRTTIFGGFKKACHTIYKFDSNTEKEFAVILENSNMVLKWLRPAERQFDIYWNKINRYEPDFVVETDNIIYMVEIKAENQVNNEEVQLKKDAAIKYCDTINEYKLKNKKLIKEWKYILIKDNDVKINYGFDRYI